MTEGRPLKAKMDRAREESIKRIANIVVSF